MTRTTTTEFILREWRFGQTQAERLCASILNSEGYTSVDPQCPLGGPDGRKDILCQKNNKKIIGACYFPTTNQSFKSIKDKLQHDLEGTVLNSATGLVFFVNQHISPAERDELHSAANSISLELYHLERICSILDSPKGYGMRLEFLRLPMTEEEQYAFWSSLHSEVTDKFITYEAGLTEIEKKLEKVLMRTNAIHADLSASQTSLFSPFGFVSSFPTEQLSIPMVLWLHKLATENEEYRVVIRGELRGCEVWIGGVNSTPETAQFIPPLASEVPRLLEELLFKWRVNYKMLAVSSYEDRIFSIVEFHHKFLSIHPFVDANGRLARCILEQQALELLGKRVAQDFVTEPGNYYKYLNSADKGDLLPLINLLKASLQ